VRASNTVVWATGTYPAQAPKITLDAWSNNVLRITNVTAANPITWEAWAGTAKDQIRLELRKRSGTGSGGDPKFMLPASATSQTLAANSLDPNSVYEGSLVFMQLPTRGAIRGRTTQFYLSTGPDFPAPTTGTAPTFAPAVGVYGESFSLGTVAAGGTVLVTGSNLGGLTKDSFDFFDPSSGSAYFVLDPVTATASAVTIPVPATLNSGSYRLRYKGGTTPQVLGTLTISGGTSPFANNVSMTSTASVISVPMPSAAVGGMTLEFWIKPASGLSSGTYRVVSKNGLTGGSELAVDLNYTSSTVANVSATVTPTGASPAVASVDLGNPAGWTHVALVIFGSSVQMFADGVAGNSFSLTSDLNWSNLQMVFGNGFRGQLDDIRIYSGLRTGPQINVDKSSPASSPYELSLQAYYKLDEGSGTSLADATGKNGPATGGNIAWGPGRSPGAWDLPSGSYVLQNDGTQLLMELGGTEGTTLYDQIFVRNGAATLDGIVNLMFIDAYTGPVSGSWHTFDLIWAQNGIVLGDHYRLVFNQPGFSVDTAVVEKDGGQLWQATVRQAEAPIDPAQAAIAARPSLGFAKSPGPTGSVELMYTYARPGGGAYLAGQYVVGGVRYEVQVSHDLKTWSSATVEEVATVPSGAGQEIATVRVVSETVRAFLRLKVSD